MLGSSAAKPAASSSGLPALLDKVPKARIRIGSRFRLRLFPDVQPRPLQTVLFGRLGVELALDGPLVDLERVYAGLLAEARSLPVHPQAGTKDQLADEVRGKTAYGV